MLAQWEHLLTEELAVGWGRGLAKSAVGETETGNRLEVSRSSANCKDRCLVSVIVEKTVKANRKRRQREIG